MVDDAHARGLRVREVPVPRHRRRDDPQRCGPRQRDREHLGHHGALRADAKTRSVELKAYVEAKGLIYLCTPFSRAAADRLERMDVPAYKIGSGECNNYPLDRPHRVVRQADHPQHGDERPRVDRAGRRRSCASAGVPFALLHCTSMYPTPYEKVRLGALAELGERVPRRRARPVAITRSATTPALPRSRWARAILEKHFTSDKTWPGPDVPISIDPPRARRAGRGHRAPSRGARRHQRRSCPKSSRPSTSPTPAWSPLRDVAAGELLDRENIWVKRPGTGEIKAAHFETSARQAQRAAPCEGRTAHVGRLR